MTTPRSLCKTSNGGGLPVTVSPAREGASKMGGQRRRLLCIVSTLAIGGALMMLASSSGLGAASQASPSRTGTRSSRNLLDAAEGEQKGRNLDRERRGEFKLLTSTFGPTFRVSIVQSGASQTFCFRPVCLSFFSNLSFARLSALVARGGLEFRILQFEIPLFACRHSPLLLCEVTPLFFENEKKN